MCPAVPCADVLRALSVPCRRAVPWGACSQLVEELLAFWSLEDYETTLEELEEALIVSERGVMMRTDAC